MKIAGGRVGCRRKYMRCVGYVYELFRSRKASGPSADIHCQSHESGRHSVRRILGGRSFTIHRDMQLCEIHRCTHCQITTFRYDTQARPMLTLLSAAAT